MAGPIVSILLKNTPSDETWKLVDEVIHEISDHVEGDEFWVISTESIHGTVSKTDGRPFGIENYGIVSEHFKLTKEEILLIKRHTDFDAKFNLVMYAGCNDTIDHKILGELALYLADELNGLIDFGGFLEDMPKDENGQIWEIPYETSEGSTAVYNIGDTDFLRDYLKNRNFKLIK